MRKRHNVYANEYCLALLERDEGRGHVRENG